MRDTNTLLLDCFVQHADRFHAATRVDRAPPPPLPDVPRRPVPPLEGDEATPWNVLIRQLGRHARSMSREQTERLVASVVDKPAATAAEIAQLLTLPGLTDPQRARLLGHPNCEGSRVIEWVMATVHDSVVFTAEQMQGQIAMLRNASGISGARRTSAWTRLALRVARAHQTESEFGGVLMASPDAATILYHVVAEVASAGSHLPSAVSRHILSHVTPVNALAVLDFTGIRHLLDFAERVSGSPDRVTSGLTDLFVASCGTDDERWDTVFRLAPRWTGSLNALLDEVERRTTDRHEHGVYQRVRRSPLLVPGHRPS